MARRKTAQLRDPHTGRFITEPIEAGGKRVIENNSGALVQTSTSTPLQTAAEAATAAELDAWEAKRDRFVERQVAKASGIQDPVLRELFLAIFTGDDGEA